MRVAVEALDDITVTDDMLSAVDSEVRERVSASAAVLEGARDLRLRLRNVKGALLCIVAVGFSGGDLVTSTATRSTPMEAVVEALDGLPDRIASGRVIQRNELRGSATHAEVRAELKRLLA